jgi:hypothetical protein
MTASFWLPAVKRSWSTDDIRALRELSLQGLPVTVIARRLGRSKSAIRNKAAMHGVPLRGTAQPDVRSIGGASRNQSDGRGPASIRELAESFDGT